MKQLWALIKKEFIQIRRDPRTFGIIVFAPVIMLILYGYAINFDIHHIKVVVYDQDHSQQSRELVRGFSSSDYFDILGYIDDSKYLLDYLDAGKARAALWIPAGFSRKLLAGNTGEIFLGIDGADSNSATIALGYFTAFIRNYSSKISLHRLEQNGQGAFVKTLVPFSIQERVWYNPELVSSHFIVPGLIAMLLMILVSLLTSMAITNEKERNTFEQLAVSPIRSWQLILGKILPYASVSFLGVLLIIPAGIILFGVPLKGNLLILLMFIMIFLTASLGIGLLISTTAKTQQQAMFAAVSVTALPSILLSGFVFPIESMPWVLQLISNIVPAKFFLIALRGIFLKGVGLEVLYPEALALSGFAIFLLTIAALRFKKRLD